MSSNKVFKIASNFESKYNLKLGGHGLGSISPGSGYRGYTGPGEETKFEKIRDFALITIPEFESFLKTVIPALKEVQKHYFAEAKKASAAGTQITPELESSMISSLMNQGFSLVVGPVKEYFTKIASAATLQFIATKIALANRQLSFFERLKDKAKSFFGGTKNNYEEMPETDIGPMLSPGLDIDLERNKVFELESQLKEIMDYVDSYIALYKSFYSNPTEQKLYDLISQAPKFKKVFEKVKTEVNQLKNLVNPSEKDIELQFFNSEKTLEEEDALSKSNITSICSYLMRDPDLKDPNNVKRAISLYKILEDKLISMNAL